MDLKKPKSEMLHETLYLVKRSRERTWGQNGHREPRE